MGKMKNSLTCPKCGSDHWDYANVGLPDALQCTDCGCVYPEVLSLFPVLKKTESSWPFPTSLRPKKLNDQLPNTRDSGNTQEAPF